MPITIAVNDYNVNNAISAFGFQTLFVARSRRCESVGFGVARRLSATWGRLNQVGKTAVDGSRYRFWAADERDYPRDTTHSSVTRERLFPLIEPYQCLVVFLGGLECRVDKEVVLHVTDLFSWAVQECSH